MSNATLIIILLLLLVLVVGVLVLQYSGPSIEGEANVIVRNPSETSPVDLTWAPFEEVKVKAAEYREIDLVLPAHLQYENEYIEVNLPNELKAAVGKRVRLSGIAFVTQSGVKNDRPQLKAALEYVRPGDTLVVWKLDRLGRSLQDLIAIVNGLARGEVGFRSLTEAIDTTTPGGKLVFHVFGAMAQFERDLLSERTLAGLEAARARGRVGGRPRALDPDQAALARDPPRLSSG